jgi:hypothetical protein
MDEGADLVCSADHLRHRLNSADLVVSEPDGNEGCAIRDGAGIREPFAVDGGDLH